MGDPAGVGPEIILKAFKDKVFAENCIPVAVGDAAAFEYYNNLLKTGLDIKKICADETDSAGGYFKKGIVPIVEPLEAEAVDFGRIEVGVPSRHSGASSFASLIRAIKLTRKNCFDAICTAPISKAALHDAEILFPGHTEILAHYTMTQNYAMLLDGGGIRVALATIHVAVKDIIRNLSAEKILSLLKLINTFFKYYGIPEPRIGVTGLNPHCGEGGLFGMEEETIISPAIEKARAKKIDAQGPFPADTIFYRMLKGDFDVILAMYHDQALIPVKTLDFHGGVNITMGLPFIRTSVDHGTAFDKAGKNIAMPDSLKAAIKTACLLAENKIAAGKQ